MSRSKKDSRWSIAACTVAVAAAVGAPALASGETEAVHSIQNYCRASWRNAGIAPQEWSDCTQQAVTELLESISSAGLSPAIRETKSQERQELNRAVWRVIQRWRRRPRQAELHEQMIGVRHGTASGDWREVSAAASDCLSQRQREILDRLRDGWRVHEIATELGVTAARVSDEKYKAIQKLRERLA